MVVFRPLRGCRYNPEVAGDLASVICPPYDMISPELQESLRKLSPYNAVHLEGGEEPDPVDPEGSYRQAAALFREWLSRRVLVRDLEPCFYLMRHGFQYRGQAKSQLGLFGGMRLEDYDNRLVLPHEYTREPAVLDRVALMEACKANFSPIMSLYRDSGGELRSVFEEVMAGQPALDVQDSPQGAVTLWPIADASVQERIASHLADKPVFLADGHHRYEAALRLRRKHSPGTGFSPESDSTSDFVMMALVEFDDPGLLLLPYHRVIGGLAPETLAQLRERLFQVFEVQPVAPEAGEGLDGLLEQVASLGRRGHVMAMVETGGAGPRLLGLRREIDWRQWGPLAVSEAWVLEEQVLKPLLGDQLQTHVGYSHDHQQSVEQVALGARQMAFLLKPFPLEAFESIVSQGQRLPSKSTFFYPKLPTGLVINQLEGRL